jgi:SAM-dependent methyltransferase
VVAAANEAQRQRWNDEQWTQLWPKRERLTSTVTPVLLEALALQPGERLLEIGCGAGAATLRASQLVGSDGLVIGADISVPLTQLATRRAAEAGMQNVSFQVRDMQTDSVDGAPFTVAMSQFGVMFFDEPVVAFTNISAQLSDGARFAFACWQAAEKNPWILPGVLTDIWPAAPVPLPGRSQVGPFVLADPAYVRNLLETAGFIDIRVTPHDTTVELPQDAVIDDAETTYAGVAPERLPAARDAVEAHLAQFRLPSGLSRFPVAYQIVTARKQ